MGGIQRLRLRLVHPRLRLGNAITIFHAGHVISVVLKGLVVFAMAYRGMFTRKRRLALEVNGLYWQFVVIIWLPLFATQYLGPHL